MILNPTSSAKDRKMLHKSLTLVCKQGANQIQTLSSLSLSVLEYPLQCNYIYI